MQHQLSDIVRSLLCSLSAPIEAAGFLIARLPGSTVGQLVRWFADADGLAHGDVFADRLPLLDTWLTLAAPLESMGPGQGRDDGCGGSAAALCPGATDFVVGLAVGRQLVGEQAGAGRPASQLEIGDALGSLERLEVSADEIVDGSPSALTGSLLEAFDALCDRQPGLRLMNASLAEATAGVTPADRRELGPVQWQRVHFLAGLVVAGVALPEQVPAVVA